MKEKKSSIHLIEDQKEKKELCHDYSYGIKKKLLEKYKPSEGLKLMPHDNSNFKEQRAA